MGLIGMPAQSSTLYPAYADMSKACTMWLACSMQQKAVGYPFSTLLVGSLCETSITPAHHTTFLCSMQACAAALLTTMAQYFCPPSYAPCKLVLLPNKLDRPHTSVHPPKALDLANAPIRVPQGSQSTLQSP
jgi:hypothetical protein